MFEQYLTDLLHSTATKCHLPPIQRGQHHVFSAEHTTRDILSFMAQVQGKNMPSKLIGSISESLIEFLHHYPKPTVLMFALFCVFQNLPCIYL